MFDFKCNVKTESKPCHQYNNVNAQQPEEHLIKDATFAIFLPNDMNANRIQKDSTNNYHTCQHSVHPKAYKFLHCFHLLEGTIEIA